LDDYDKRGYYLRAEFKSENIGVLLMNIYKIRNHLY